MTASDSARAGTEQQGLVIERIFDAPRELVWRAWTEPEHFMRWYGPQGMTLPSCEIDFRVGGRHLFGMRSPDGQEYWSSGVYREIVPLERFVFTDSPADEHGNVVLQAARRWCSATSRASSASRDRCGRAAGGAARASRR